MPDPILAPADDARAQLYALGWWLQSRAWDRECEPLETAQDAFDRLIYIEAQLELASRAREKFQQVT